MKNNFTFSFVFVVSCFVISPLAKASPGAASQVAQNDPICIAVQPFYWEIGSSQGVIVHGQSGGGTFNESTPMPIASSSKFVFGAYVVERKRGQLNAFDIKSLGMASGYDNFKNCDVDPNETVAGCLEKAPKPIYLPRFDGAFWYNSGPFEVWGYANALGPMNADQLTQEYKKYLGADLGMVFLDPLFAGALKTTPAFYRKFLQKILAGQLIISRLLGAYPRCTNPSTCGAAVQSPVPYSWHYSLGHWVENDPTRSLDDGSFSSPGAYGFYPWISANKKFYGIVARADNSPKAYLKSVECGQRIRKAFFVP